MKQQPTQLILTPQEEQFIIGLYHSRMMTKAYLDETVPQSLKTGLLEKGLIMEESVEDWQEENWVVYYLTQTGADKVYDLLNLPGNVRNEKESITEKNRFRQSDLRPRKESHRRRLLETTRFVEGVKQRLEKYPQIKYRYYDQLFNKQLAKQQEHHIPQLFPSDGVLLFEDYEIHIHSLQERLTKVKLFTENEYLPFVKSEAFRYRERPILLLYLVETQEEVKIYRERVCEMIGASLTPLFNIFVLTTKQALQFVKNKLIPELIHPHYLFQRMTNQIQRPSVAIQRLNQEKLAHLKGQYDRVITYQNKVAFFLDYRYKDVLSHYTLTHHFQNQKTLQKQIFLLALNNEKLSGNEINEQYQYGCYSVSFEKLKDEKWLQVLFHQPRP